jgi:hypothetical protein
MSEIAEKTAGRLQGIHQVIEEVKSKVETNVTDKEKEMLKVSFKGALKSQIAS